MAPNADPGPIRARDLAAHQHPILHRSLLQIATSVVPYVGLWVAMVWSLGISYWLTLALAVPAAGFAVRTFIVFHDCGHGSFFRSRRANEIVGFVCGVLTLTPSHDWWYSHARHHATSGNLDRRGIGDVWTLTVDEYRARSWAGRLFYRIVRFPPFMLLVGPIVMFVVLNRFPSRGARAREVRNVIATNLTLAALVGGLIWLIGWQAYLMIHLPVILLSGGAGIWLFYVQHQFEDVYWERQEGWDAASAAIQGSSYFKLPRILQWFSGNIGFHHVHHLSARVPNYALEACHESHAALRRAPTLTLRTSLSCFGLQLWDERRQKLVSFGEARRSRAVEPSSETSGGRASGMATTS
ncbi:fatty acid desaturase [bacterium]|nr:fatty acid desaturase [bacterium]